MKYALFMLATLAGTSTTALADPPMLPVGATLRYEVAVPGGPWTNNVTIGIGQRVEWRAVLSYSGTTPASALGRIYYQPVLSNVDNTGTRVDSLGTWRNGGISGIGNTTLRQGLLSSAEGASSAALSSYGRVGFGSTSRSATNSGGLTGHRHTFGEGDAPAGSYIRVAGSVATNWYGATAHHGDNILLGVVSDNPAASSSWFQSGTTNIVIFRQAFFASLDLSVAARTVTITSDAGSLQRAGGSAGTDDTRFMTWAAPGEGGSNATIRVGVAYIPATIRIRASLIPAPATPAVVATLALFATRRRRSS